MTLRQRYSRYIGDRAFYKALLGILVPVVLQNSLTNLVSLLDNIMIGSVGTEQMSGISIVNQLINVFNICVYGALSGASIFTVQFIGSKDLEGVRHTFRFKMFAVFAALALGIGIFTVYGETLISLYLHEGGDTGDLVATLVYGKEYLAIMLWGLIPFVVQQAYASTMREVGETVLPMKAGIVAIFVNLVLNYLLIFGKFGFPVMGVRGAALATVLSRFVETSIIVVWAHTHKKKLPFIEHVYRSLRVPLKLVGQILLRGYPLLINEFLWAAAMALISQSFSIRGLAAVASMNINTTIANLFNVVWLSMGTVVAIMIGRPLGANDFDKARETLRQTIAFSVVVSTVIALILAVLSPLSSPCCTTPRRRCAISPPGSFWWSRPSRRSRRSRMPAILLSARAAEHGSPSCLTARICGFSVCPSPACWSPSPTCPSCRSTRPAPMLIWPRAYSAIF